VLHFFRIDIGPELTLILVANSGSLSGCWPQSGKAGGNVPVRDPDQVEGDGCDELLQIGLGQPDLASTLLAAMIRKSGGSLDWLAFHIDDGVIAAELDGQMRP
jgi:hypothetical protein